MATSVAGSEGRDADRGTPAPLSVGDRDASRMVLCTTCGQVRGPWRYVSDDAAGPEFVQRCRCEPRDDARWPRFDYNTAVELCWCCAAEAIGSGSRWSHVMCPECHARAVALRRRLGRFVVPIGRHSMMNGVGLRPSTAPGGSPDVAPFVEGLTRLRGGITALWEWSHRQAMVNLAAIGAAGSDAVALADYSAAVTALPVDKAAVFAVLCREFGLLHLPDL